MDRYKNFQNLKQFETAGTDFRIRWRMGRSGIGILSIHGGGIEPGTSEIAEAIAGNDHTFYAFEGIKPKGNKNLHLTSTLFDEPTALWIVCQVEIILAIHGCAEEDTLVYVGGMDLELRERIGKFLAGVGFRTQGDGNPDFQGKNPANICNIGGRGMGIQFEISRGLRARMFNDLTPLGRKKPTALFFRFVRAVRQTLKPFQSC